MQARRRLEQGMVETAMASPATRAILSLCIQGPRSVKDLSAEASIPLASCYRQVRALVEDGMLVVERSAMTADGKPYDLYRSRIRLARIEVRAGKVEVTWEANAPVEDRVLHFWGQLRT